MTDPESPYAAPPAPVPLPTAPTPRRSLPTILTIVAAVILVPCLCCGGLGAFFARGIYIAASERGNVQQVMDEYMRRMEAGDIDGAYTLFSARAQRQMSREQLRQLLDDPTRELFSDYQQATVTNIVVSSSFHSDQDQPQGTVAKVEGTISYAGGVSGTFASVLEREGEQWRIHHININVPPGQVPQE